MEHSVRKAQPLSFLFARNFGQKCRRFDKMVTGMVDPEMIEDTAKIVNEAIKDKAQVNLINNRAGGNAPLIARRSPIGSIRKSSRGCSKSIN